MSGFKIHNFSGGYGSKRIVHDVTTPNISKGSVVALLGANGAGKSTLLKMVAGILNNETGFAELNGINLQGLPLRKRVELVAYMEQDPATGSSLLAYESILTTLRINSSLSMSDTHKRVEAVSDLLSLGELMMKPLSQMSGGQRQMISFAHVLARDPELMLLDEPTSALDLKKQVEVMMHIKQSVKDNNSVAVVIVHDLNLAARYSDYLLVMGNGGILLDCGEPEKIMNSALLEEAYGIHGRVERCSEGFTQVIVDRTVTAF